jgi:Cu/Ag efflux protein CusF
LKRMPLVLTAASILALAVLASCHRVHPKSEGAKGDEKLYYGVGVVESVDKSLKTIQIDHEDIKDFMPAMSMPYHVKNESMLDSFQKGDKVDFTIQDSGGVLITEIKKHEP